LRDRVVARAISRTDLISRNHLAALAMVTVISPQMPLLKMQQGGTPGSNFIGTTLAGGVNFRSAATPLMYIKTPSLALPYDFFSQRACGWRDEKTNPSKRNLFMRFTRQGHAAFRPRRRECLKCRRKHEWRGAPVKQPLRC
jgi:hypothetical protein